MEDWGGSGGWGIWGRLNQAGLWGMGDGGRGV